MKLSKNVLVGSLASAGIILGALAPAMTAQAATTTGNIDADGNVTANADSEGKLVERDYGVLGKDGTSIAFDSGVAGDNQYGKASAESNANVQVLSGVLVLQAVPDFGFGSGAAGSTVALKNNEATGTGKDGNAQGLLQVTDARSAAPGFSLTAKMGNFTEADGTAIAADKGSGADFNLNLASGDLTGGDGLTAGEASPISTMPAKLVSSNKDSDQATIMNPKAGSYKVGDLKTTFTTPESAELSIPAGLSTNDVKNPSVKSYTSMITWTLNAAPTVTAPAAG